MQAQICKQCLSLATHLTKRNALRRFSACVNSADQFASRRRTGDELFCCRLVSTHRIPPKRFSADDNEKEEAVELYTLPASHYANEMKILAKEQQVERAHELFKTVCHADGIRPQAYMYNILIGGYGRLGDVKTAFQLYRDMKSRALEPDGSTYTGLFNACANCRERKLGLSRATTLREKLQKLSWIPNTTNYLAMMKAFGRCGDFSTALCLADEMVADGHVLNSRIMETLLSACIPDSKMGFYWGQQVWMKFRRRRVQPSLHCYNLLLRLTRDCGAGNEAAMPVGKFYLGSLPVRDCDPVLTAGNMSKVETDELVLKEDMPESRLQVIGGVNAVLSQLEDDGLVPDVRTFSVLLELLPSSQSEEEVVLAALDRHKVEPDTTLYNMLIKRRNMRGDYDSALKALSLMQSKSLVPDILTFGVLALGCRSRFKARQFLVDMKAAGFQPNIEIFGSLLKNACFRKDWAYAREMLAEISSHHVLPNKRVLQLLEMTVYKTKEMLVQKEKGQTVPAVFHNYDFVEQFRLFLLSYEGWLCTTTVESRVSKPKQLKSL